MAVNNENLVEVGPGPTGLQLSNIRVCVRCDLRYDWRRSPSTLRMTYCSSLCEKGDLGFTIEALLKNEAIPPVAAIAEPPV